MFGVFRTSLQHKYYRYSFQTLVSRQKHPEFGNILYRLNVGATHSNLRNKCGRYIHIIHNILKVSQNNDNNNKISHRIGEHYPMGNRS